MKNKFDLKAKIWEKKHYRIKRALKVSLSIKKQIVIKKNMTALEFGCGTGLLGFNLINEFNYLTFMDTSKKMLEQVKFKLLKNNIKNANVLHCDLVNEPLNNNFDCIFTLMVLHHISNLKKIINKLVTLLNPSGFICISDIDKEDGSFHDSEEIVPHFGFERKKIIEELKNNRLKNIKSSTAYINKKLRNNKSKEYPVFLITGQK